MKWVKTWESQTKPSFEEVNSKQLEDFKDVYKAEKLTTYEAQSLKNLFPVPIYRRVVDVGDSLQFILNIQPQYTDWLYYAIHKRQDEYYIIVFKHGHTHNLKTEFPIPGPTRRTMVAHRCFICDEWQGVLDCIRLLDRGQHHHLAQTKQAEAPKKPEPQAVQKADSLLDKFKKLFGKIK